MTWEQHLMEKYPTLADVAGRIAELDEIRQWFLLKAEEEAELEWLENVEAVMLKARSLNNE